MTSLAKNLRFLIPNRGASALASELDIDPSWLNRVMNPDRSDGIKDPRDGKLAKIAKRFGVTVEALKHSDLSTAEVRAPVPHKIDPVIFYRAFSEVSDIISAENGGLLDLRIPSHVDALCALYDQMIASGGTLSARDGHALVMKLKDILGAPSEPSGARPTRRPVGSSR